MRRFPPLDTARFTDFLRVEPPKEDFMLRYCILVMTKLSQGRLVFRVAVDFILRLRTLCDYEPISSTLPIDDTPAIGPWTLFLRFSASSFVL